MVGIAGSDEKVAWLKEIGFDSGINYKTEDLDEALQREAPDGVDAYFDNVGGECLEACLRHFNNYGRIAFCGAISNYNGPEGQEGHSVKNFEMILMRRLKAQGFICPDHLADVPECFAELMKEVAAGNIQFKEHIEEGIERYVDVVNMLYKGENTGKLMLKINAE